MMSFDQKYFKYGFVLSFVFGTTFGSANVQAFEASCIHTKVVSGSSCQDMKIDFDFSGCGEGAPTGRTVRSTCVNQKSVSFVRTGDQVYIATYGAPTKEGEPWKRLSIRSESRSVKAKEETSRAESDLKVAIVPVAKPSSTQAQVQTEDLTTKEKTKVDEALQKSQEEVKSASTAASLSAEASQKQLNIPEVPAPKVDVPVVSAKTEAAPLVKKEEEKKPVETKNPLEGFKFSGSLDTYYAYNNNTPAIVTAPTSIAQPAPQNKYRAYDVYHDTMSLALAELTVEKSSEFATARMDFGFGNNAARMTSNDQATQNILQAYVQIKMTPKASLYVGKLFSHMGWETPYAADNWNYSRSILNTYSLPLWYNGMALVWDAVPEKFSTGLYLMNGWSGVYEVNRTKTGGLRLAWTPSKEFLIAYNGIFGNEASNVAQFRQVHELILTWDMNSKWSLALDASSGSETKALSNADVTWSAYSLALNWKLGRFTMSPRYEIVTDTNGYVVGAAMGSAPASALVQNLSSATLTGTWDLGGGAKTSLEFRQDQSDKTPFLDTNLAASGQQMTGLWSFIFQY